MLSKPLLKSLISQKIIRNYSAKATIETVNLWKNVSLYVCLPALLVTFVHTYLAEKEHLSHPRPEFKKYDHMYIRTKPFPWGDGNHSLFHHPIYNALPEGYENPDPNADNHH